MHRHRTAKNSSMLLCSATVEELEPRRLLSAGGSVAADGLPLLHSLPGAPAAVFLDFDGYGSNTPFDTDGDPATFGAAEQADVTEAWRHVAAYFSMFDLDVTTEQPPESVPYSYSVISNSVPSGTNLGNFPSVLPINFNSSIEARLRQTAIAHEIGHSFGLEHQSEFDRQGVKVAEYAPGYDRLHGPIMGMDTDRDVHKWFIGHPSQSPLLLQDDLAVIAEKLRPYTGGDGFRPDDVRGTREAASPLASDEWGVQRAAGIIERVADADVFSFSSGGGRVSVDLVPPAPSMLDGKLEIYSADGTLLAAADAPENDQHLVFPQLAAGTYYAAVGGHRDYADLGPYELIVSQEEAAAEPGPEYNDLPAPRNLTLAHGAGTGVELLWDATPGALGYSIERSDDGLVWQQTAATAAGAPTALNDPDLPGRRRYFYRVSATNGAGRSAPSAAASLVTRPGAVTSLSLTRYRFEAFVLNWRDVSGETGYRIERRLEGSGEGFTVVGEVGRNVPSFTDRSIEVQTVYHYRVIATSSSGDSAAAEIDASTPLTTINALHVTDRQPGQVRLEWSAAWGVPSYVVERSEDGLNFVTVATTADPQYFDASVAAAAIYYYRVSGTNGLGETGTSATVIAATPATAPVAPPWQTLAIGTAPAGAVGYGAATEAFAVVGGGTTYAKPGSGGFVDSLQFVYRTLSGNGTILGRITAQTALPTQALAGIMFRESIEPGAPFVFTGVSPQYGWFSQARQRMGLGAGAPVRLGSREFGWFRITRTGSQFTVSHRTGPTGTWTSRGGYNLTMGATVVVGLAVTAGSDDALSAATFDSVSLNNDGPYVVTPAAANPEQVTGSTSQLSVLAGDMAGESTLTYTWSAVSLPPGAPAPTFSRNSSNLAKATTATFARPGHYALRVTVRGGQGLTVESAVEVDVVVTPKRVALTSQGVPLPLGGTLQLSAAITDQFGQPYQPPPSQPAPVMTWSAEHGTVDQNGLYSAPADWSGWDRITVSAGGATGAVLQYVYDPSGNPVLVSASSRKLHGRQGYFDLPLALYFDAATVEPRRGGPTTLRFTFSKPVFAADGVLDASEFVISRSALFGSAQVTDSVITLELARVAFRSLVTVALRGLVDDQGRALQGDSDVAVGALEGDVTGNRWVNRADVLAVRRHLTRPVGGPQFLLDINLDGSVTALDLLFVRRHTGFIVG